MRDIKAATTLPNGRMQSQGILTRFLNCLWMASSASLMVTPFMFRAVTSNPSGKCRAMDLSLGSVRGSFKTDGSSTVLGDLFSFLEIMC